MNPILTYLMTQSLQHTFTIIIILTFLESLILTSFLLPSILLMTTIGTLIGSSVISFYTSCIAGTIGSLIGDWISYFIGWKIRNKLYNLNLFKKRKNFLKKIKNKTYNNILKIIIIGKFIRTTRPLIGIILSILNLPFKKIFFSNIIGCIIWPPISFLPGILTGVILKTPKYIQKDHLIFSIISTIFILWISIWLYIQDTKKIYNAKLIYYLSPKMIKNLSILFFFLGIIKIFNILINPKIILLKNIIKDILKLIN